MSAATLDVRSLTEVSADAQLVTLDCPHGTTRVGFQPGNTDLSRNDLVCLALLKHHLEEGCRCTRKLWRKHFGCPWPEMPLVWAEGMER